MVLSRFIKNIPRINSKEVLAILDISNDSIKIMVYYARANATDYRVVYTNDFEAIGFYDGVLHNIVEAVNNLAYIFDKVESVIRKRVTSVIVNTPVSQTNSLYHAVSTKVFERMNQENIDQIINPKRYEHLLDDDQFIVSVTIEDLILDGKRVSNPLMYWVKNFEANVHIVSVFKPYVMNLVEIFSSLRLSLIGLIYLPKAVPFQLEQERNYSLIDIGLNNTTISLYSNSQLESTYYFSIGYNKIYKDIALDLRIDLSLLGKLSEKISHNINLRGKIIEILTSSGIVKVSYDRFNRSLQKSTMSYFNSILNEIDIEIFIKSFTLHVFSKINNILMINDVFTKKIHDTIIVGEQPEGFRTQYENHAYFYLESMFKYYVNTGTKDLALHSFANRLNKIY